MISSELKRKKNLFSLLAVRDTGGTFVISQSRTRSPHGKFRAGGVIFTYTGGTSSRGDHIAAHGPLRNSVDVMVNQFFPVNYQ